eukprot:g12192.t1
MARVSGQSNGDSKTSGGTDDDAGPRDSGTASRAGSGGRRRGRPTSSTLGEPSSARSRESNNQARRSAGGGDLHPVGVKRDGASINSVPDDDEKSRAFSEQDAVLKTEDIEVSCKTEPTGTAGVCE